MRSMPRTLMQATPKSCQNRRLIEAVASFPRCHGPRLFSFVVFYCTTYIPLAYLDL
jgi:hypothetical protein